MRLTGLSVYTWAHIILLVAQLFVSNVQNVRPGRRLRHRRRSRRRCHRLTSLHILNARACVSLYALSPVQFTDPFSHIL